MGTSSEMLIPLPTTLRDSDHEYGSNTKHGLRATFASLRALAGAPITEIQGMLGHKCITTTMIYIETSLEAKRRAQDALSLKLELALERFVRNEAYLLSADIHARLHGN